MCAATRSALSFLGDEAGLTDTCTCRFFFCASVRKLHRLLEGSQPLVGAQRIYCERVKSEIFPWRGAIDLVFPSLTLKVATWVTYLLRSFLISIPMDFEEAARIDGANDLQVFLRVILPLAWPGFLTVVLVVGLAVWNEFLFAVTFLQRPELKPISTSLLAFQTRFQRDWGLTSAASVIMIIPIIILFLSLQRQFIEGLTRGGLKG
uniref:Carbohydrate ABC transporter permease n=1 Tax=Caldilinea aerophila TaxID=133453 RepID=A0A7C1FJJ8_9CHLR